MNDRMIGEQIIAHNTAWPWSCIMRRQHQCRYPSICVYSGLGMMGTGSPAVRSSFSFLRIEWPFAGRASFAFLKELGVIQSAVQRFCTMSLVTFYVVAVSRQLFLRAHVYPTIYQHKAATFCIHTIYIVNKKSEDEKMFMMSLTNFLAFCGARRN